MENLDMGSSQTSLLRKSKVEEEKEDRALRPTDLSGYIGQVHLKEVLDVAIEAAKERGELLEHTLIWGPPGYGKTTLAHIIANEMEAEISIFIGGHLRTPKDASNIFLADLSNQIYFIDEIHRMWIPAQEMLYPPLEDNILNKKFGGSMMITQLSPFTLIGATTDPELLSQPFKDRFGLKLELEPYSLEELSTIVSNSAEKLKLSITDQAVAEVSRGCFGTPRIANNILRRLRDFAQYHEVVEVDEEFVKIVLSKKGLRYRI